MNNNDMKNERLMPLRDMKGYKVAKDNVDVVGWRVVGSDGETLGTVKDLIVDPQIMKVRYLSVLAENKFFNTDTDQHMLVPIGAAALDKKGKNVFVSYIDSRTISNYPVYAGDHIPEDYEYAVRDSIQRAQNDTLPDTSAYHREEFDQKLNNNRTETRTIPADFYEHDTFNESRFYASDEDLNRDETYATTHDFKRTDATADMPGSSRTTSVEDSIETIERLESLRKRGSITEEEFILMKKRALNL